MQAEITVIPSRRPPSSLSSWRGEFAPAVESAASGEGQRILIVEDDFLVAAQMEAALSDAGFAVAGIVATGEEALQLAEAQPLTLVIMDIRLAGSRDGIDTALELFRLHSIRCIFASAYSDQEARQRAAPADPLGWLQKPYTMVSLTAMVHEAVSELRGQHD